MIPTRIHALLNGIATGERHFPPTLLYNEGWMLRLILDWFAHHQGLDHALAFMSGSNWFSEALLPSAFLPRKRGDPHGELHTRADAVIGHFKIRAAKKAGLDLAPDSRQFIVVEAKMLSGLSQGTRNAVFFNQAARNIACMAEVLYCAKQAPIHVTRLGFVVIAPKSQIRRGLFEQLMEREAIRSTVLKRVLEYEGEKQEWFTKQFEPMLNCIDIETITWESVIDFISGVDAREGEEIASFYRQCLLHCGTSGGQE